MPTNLPSTTYQTVGPVPWIGRGLIAVALVALTAYCGLLVINEPQIRAAAEAQEARIVEEENSAFCSKFGIGPATTRYAECAAGLIDMRARRLQRSGTSFIF